MPRTRFAKLSAAALLAAAGCSAATTPEGALQDRNPTLKITWIGDETRAPPFDMVMLAPVEIEFRQVAPVTGVGRPQADVNEFPVSEEDREQLTNSFTKIFREELGKSEHFSLVDRPGPGVLIVRPSLRDIVSRVPPQEPLGRSATYLDTVADATLVVELVDAATERMLGTATDRSTAQPSGTVGNFGDVRAVKPMTDQQMRRLLRRWAIRLEKRLDQLYFEAKPR